MNQRPPVQNRPAPRSSTQNRKAPPPPPPKRRRLDLPIFLIAIVMVVAIVWTMLPKSTPITQPSDGGTDGTHTAVPSDQPQPILSEIMTSNGDAVSSADGNSYDYIEVYNPSSQNINLGGYALSDNPKKPAKFVFPTMQLKPGEYVVVFASGTQVQGELHADFGLKASGTPVLLCDTQGGVLETLTVPNMAQNTSYVRDMKNPTEWKTTEQYTPGFSNDEAGWTAYQATLKVEGSKLVLSEIMTSNNITMADADGNYNDYIELFNGGEKAVNLKNYGLSDREGSPKRWVFPDVTIEPGKYLLVYASGMNSSDPKLPLHTSFRLNSMASKITLCNERGQFLDQVDVPELQSDTVYARPGGAGWEVMTKPSPGFPNSDEGFNAFQESLNAAGSKKVVINEVMPNNSKTLKDENNQYTAWIELKNTSAETINLAGYGLTDNSSKLGQWKLPEVTLGAGEYLTVFADGRNVTDTKKLHTNFKLSNAGGPLVLTNNEGAVADVAMVSAMDPDVSIGRPEGSMIFHYQTSPTPGAANGQGAAGMATTPQILTKSGQFDAGTSLQVEIKVPEGTQVYYTLDAQTPTKNSTPYTGPITVSKTTIVRASAFKDNYLPSQVADGSYFIGENHTLPIVSIVTDPKNLFDPTTGIYEKGPDAKATFPFKGANFWKQLEVPAHMSLLEKDGTIPIDQTLGIRIFGAYTRGNRAKSFAVIANSKYGKNTIDYPVFENQPDIKEYKSLVLRNGASEWAISVIRDVALTSLVAETTEIPVQAYRPSILYLNDKYWGVYFIREKITDNYLASHYKIPEESVNLLVGNASVQKGSNEDYKALVDYAKNHDLSVKENYEYMQAHMDIQNYMDYVIAEMYTANTDTGNIKMWMSPAYDGKWRWIFYDVDWAFLKQTEDYVGEYIDPAGNGVSNMFDNTLIRKLLENAEFKEAFLNRFAYHTNVTFEPQHVIDRINEIAEAIDPEMTRDRQRWSGEYLGETINTSYSSWKKSVESLRTYAKKRPDTIKELLKKNFNLSDADITRYFGK